MVAALSKVYWNDGPLKNGLRAANKIAGGEVAAFAKEKNPAPSKIKVVGPIPLANGDIQEVRGTGPLAHIFESGRRGGYVIQPGLRTAGKLTAKTARGALRVTASRPSKIPGREGEQSFIAIRFNRGDGGFYRGAGFLGGAMAARAYLKPAAVIYPSAFNRAAPPAIAAAGARSGAAAAAFFRAA